MKNRIRCLVIDAFVDLCLMYFSLALAVTDKCSILLSLIIRLPMNQMFLRIEKLKYVTS